jgi:hypothetical protein
VTRQPEADRRRAALSQVVGALASIRRRAWALLTLRRVLLTLAAAVGTVIALATLDLLLRLPTGLRWVHWGFGLGALVAALRVWVWPAVRFHPSLTQVALRVERSEPGRMAGLQGLLATGLELSTDVDAGGVRASLSARAVREAAERFGNYRGHLVAKTPAVRAAGALAMSVAVVAILALLSPQYAKIGALRTLAPWAGASWPRVTEVASATEREVQALGVAVPLRAALLRTPEPLGETRVEAWYRVIANGEPGPQQKVALTGQRRHISIERGGTITPAELYERLVEIAPPGGVDEATVEYWFQTRDHRTPTARLRLVEPPSVLRARAQISPPEYAAQLTAAPAAAAFRAGAFDLGPGADERASVGPVLAGSTIELEITLNKPVPGAEAGAESAFAAATFGHDRWAEGLQASGDTWRLRWIADAPARLPVIVQDEYGIRSAEEAVFSFDVTQDDPATVAVTRPAEDDWYLPTALVNLEGEGRDRVGLAWLELRRQLLRPPGGSPGAPPEPMGDEQALARRDLPEPSVREVIRWELELARLDVTPGDVVEITAVAQDTLGASAIAAGAEPLPGRPARSPARRLRIIDEATFLEQAHGSLATIRESAKRLDEDQRELSAALRGDDGLATLEGEQAAARQSGISERINQQAEAVNHLRERAEQNRLDDPALAGLLDQAQRRLAEAGRQSVEAGDGLSQQARAEQDEDPGREAQAARAAQQAQDGVRDELGRLIDLLDRGEDTWMVRRDLQRALEQQRELRRQTDEATRDTVGRRPDELTPEESQRLEELARQQEELAREAREVIEELSQRAEQSAERNPTGAEAMRQAAQRGRGEQAAENMREAAEQIEQNQGQSATDQQDRALETLEQMMQDLDQAERNRDEQLRRALADLLATINQLIATQTRELDRLAAAEPGADFAGLDAPMIELSRNTLGAAELARSGFQELESVAGMLLEAADAQEQAIVVLRASEIISGEAREQELASLDALTRAREEAERLRREAEQREAERQRAELERAYREALEQQISLRDETATFNGAEMNRRQQMLVRRLSGRQAQIRKDLGILRQEIEAIESTAVFSYAHDRIDRASRAAEGLLRAGDAGDPALRRQNEVIRVLQAMLQAFRDLNRRQDEEFSRGAGGGDSSGGEQGEGEEEGAVPDMAELLLLKAMQQEAADDTRAIHDGLLDVAELPGVTQLQRDLSLRGGLLIEQLQQEQQGEQPQPPPRFEPLGFQNQSDEPPQEEQPEQGSRQERRQQPEELPGLDELLGLPDDEPSDDAAGGQLEEILSEREISERFQEAVRLMGQTAGRLDQRDTGIATQRLQEDILARLDALIAAADQRVQQQQQQQQQQRGDPEQAPAQQQQQARAQDPTGDNRGEESVVGQRDAQLGPEAARGADWGTLPPKWRDALRQGDSDSFSRIYRAATEAYYRRLAEEAGR